MKPLPESARVSIVIVGFGQEQALEKCLASIRSGTHREYRIHLVDNSLSDILEKRFSSSPDIDYVPTGTNAGFTRGCNLGIARSLAEGSDYTLLLNPDTELDPDCLEKLVGAARALPRAGIVGGRIRFSGDPARTWYAGGTLSLAGGVGKHLTSGGGDGPPAETSYVTGCCMLVPNAVLERVGGLDERIFMYLDDAEFCLRVRRAGYALYYHPGARLAHAVGPGADWRRYPDYYLYFSVRNRPLVAAGGGLYRLHLHLVALAVAAVKAGMYGLLPGVPHRRRSLRALWWGAWDSLFREARERRRFPRLFERKGGTRGYSGTS